MFTERIASVELQPDGALWVVRRFPSGMAYCSGDMVPDRVVREIYVAQNGKVVLAATVDGKHIPARSVPESFVFGEDGR